MIWPFVVIAHVEIWVTIAISIPPRRCEADVIPGDSCCSTHILELSSAVILIEHIGMPSRGEFDSPYALVHNRE